MEKGRQRRRLLVGAAIVGMSAFTLAANASPITLERIQPILSQRCAECHAARPTMMSTAPEGVMLDSPDNIMRNAQRLYHEAVQTKAMPLGNVTQMTDGERSEIAQWFEQGAHR